MMWKSYLSLTLPGDEKAVLVHFHVAVGLKDVGVLQQGKMIVSKQWGRINQRFYLTQQDIKQSTCLKNTGIMQSDNQM